MMMMTMVELQRQRTLVGGLRVFISAGKLTKLLYREVPDRLARDLASRPALLEQLPLASHHHEHQQLRLLSSVAAPTKIYLALRAIMLTA